MPSNGFIEFFEFCRVYIKKSEVRSPLSIGIRSWVLGLGFRVLSSESVLRIRRKSCRKAGIKD